MASVLMDHDSYVLLLGSPVVFMSLMILSPLKNGIIEQGAALLQLSNTKQFNDQLLVRAAKELEDNDRISDAIKLYNLAGDYTTVISCLAQALGNSISQPTPDDKARTVEKTAGDILRHYQRTNRAAGKDRDAVVRLLRVRDALDAKAAGRPELALEVSVSFVESKGVSFGL